MISKFLTVPSLVFEQFEIFLSKFNRGEYGKALYSIWINRGETFQSTISLEKNSSFFSFFPAFCALNLPMGIG